MTVLSLLGDAFNGLRHTQVYLVLGKFISSYSRHSQDCLHVFLDLHTERRQVGR